MSIEIRKTESKEIKKNIQTVRKMTNGMSFDENMGKVNWRLYRKLEQMQVEVRMIQMKGAFHAFATTGTQAPETKQILFENIAFMKDKF